MRRQFNINKFTFALFFVLTLSCCVDDRKNNTRFSSLFSEKKFNDIKFDDNKSDVISLLGEPLKVMTHVNFSDGSGNNYKGIKKSDDFENLKSIHYLLHFSEPIHSKSHHVVYQVLFNSNWKVVSVESYHEE